MANDKTTAPQVDFSRLPRHVAIILDGKGRWAKTRGLPRTAGHAYGAEAFRRIGNYCKAIGIEYLTVYAFSTENWRRPPEEVRTIMSIFDKYMKEALSIMERDKFKMRFFGERSGLSPELQRLMAAAEEKSTHYDGCQMNLCINYGGRDEILCAGMPRPTRPVPRRSSRRMCSAAICIRPAFRTPTSSSARAESSA